MRDELVESWRRKLNERAGTDNKRATTVSDAGALGDARRIDPECARPAGDLREMHRRLRAADLKPLAPEHVPKPSADTNG